MALPAGVSTATLIVGVPVNFSGAPLKSYISIKPSVSLVHIATGTPLVNLIDRLETTEGAAGQFALPHTDQDGFQDENGNAYKNWYYTATIQYAGTREVLPETSKTFQLLVGQDVVDLDLLPSGVPAMPWTGATAGVTSVAGQTGAVPVSAIMNTPEASAAILGIAVPQQDRGRRAMSKLGLGATTQTWAMAGDSTGDALLEWADMTVAGLVANRPRTALNVLHWDDATQAYTAPEPYQSGVSARTTVFRDEFNRTASDLYGTVPNVGSAWSYDGASALGDWSLDGDSAVASADTTRGVLLADLGATGDVEINATFVSPVPASGAPSVRIMAKYANNTNFLYFVLSLNTAGVYSASVARQVGGSSNTLKTITGVNASPDNTYKVKLQVVGDRYTASVNGMVFGATLTGAEVTAVAASTKAGIYGTTPGTVKFERFQVDSVTALVTPPTVTLYNGSRAGSDLTYQQSRIASLYPVAPDVLLLCSGHNYTTTTPEAYVTALDAFLTAFRAVHPTTGIVISSQNPRFSPATDIAAHLERQTVLLDYCAKRGYGYIPSGEAYAAFADGGRSLIASDGVHPLGGPTGTGSALQRDTAIAHFESLVTERAIPEATGVLVSPNGTRFRISVADDGALTTTSL